MEFLDPYEAKKFNKQKWERFWWTHCKWECVNGKRLIMRYINAGFKAMLQCCCTQ